jgi:hypothetical protein
MAAQYVLGALKVGNINSGWLPRRIIFKMSPAAFSVLGNRMLLYMEMCE